MAKNYQPYIFTQRGSKRASNASWVFKTPPILRLRFQTKMAYLGGQSTYPHEPDLLLFEFDITFYSIYYILKIYIDYLKRCLSQSMPLINISNRSWKP